MLPFAFTSVNLGSSETGMGGRSWVWGGVGGPLHPTFPWGMSFCSVRGHRRILGRRLLQLGFRRGQATVTAIAPVPSDVSGEGLLSLQLQLQVNTSRSTRLQLRLAHFHEALLRLGLWSLAFSPKLAHPVPRRKNTLFSISSSGRLRPRKEWAWVPL